MNAPISKYQKFAFANYIDRGVWADEAHKKGTIVA